MLRNTGYAIANALLRAPCPSMFTYMLHSLLLLPYRLRLLRSNIACYSLLLRNIASKKKLDKLSELCYSAIWL